MRTVGVLTVARCTCRWSSSGARGDSQVTMCLVQVVVERLRTEWKLEVSTGEMRVAYREVRE